MRPPGGELMPVTIDQAPWLPTPVFTFNDPIVVANATNWAGATIHLGPIVSVVAAKKADRPV